MTVFVPTDIPLLPFDVPFFEVMRKSFHFFVLVKEKEEEATRRNTLGKPPLHETASFHPRA
jgi:hypothetical protein